jgi:hypothetical protein
MKIGANLALALRYLRYTQKPRTLWVDAICLNQQDRAECGAQVSVVNEIYGAAIIVIIWLGGEDEFLEDALSLIKSVGSIPVERHLEVTLRDWFNQRAVFRRLGLQQPPKINHWLGIIAFSKGHSSNGSGLFILAKDVVVVCGNETFLEADFELGTVHYHHLMVDVSVRWLRQRSYSPYSENARQ